MPVSFILLVQAIGAVCSRDVPNDINSVNQGLMSPNDFDMALCNATLDLDIVPDEDGEYAPLYLAIRLALYDLSYSGRTCGLFFILVRAISRMKWLKSHHLY